MPRLIVKLRRATYPSRQAPRIDSRTALTGGRAGRALWPAPSTSGATDDVGEHEERDDDPDDDRDDGNGGGGQQHGTILSSPRNPYAEETAAPSESVPSWVADVRDASGLVVGDWQRAEVATLPGTKRVRQAGHARAPASTVEGAKSPDCQRDLAALAREWTRVPHLSFPRNEGVPGSSPGVGS